MKPGLSALPRTRFVAAVCCAVLLWLCPAPGHAGERSLRIEALPISAFTGASQIDERLRFSGGLVLSSEDEEFGGFSGVRLLENGHRLVAISDTGNWLTATVERNAEEQPTKLSDEKLSCLCRRDGTPYPSKHWSDSEALEIEGNTAWVAFERLHRINRYPLGPHLTPGAPVQATPSLANLGLEYNKGLEALARIPSGIYTGKLIAIAEDTRSANGDHRGFILGENSIDELSIAETDGYSVTDADFTPDGSLLLLERYFSILGGIGMRIREVQTDAIRAGARVEPEILMESRSYTEIDNMEALGIWQDKKGRTRLTTLSDDNFSSSQRTLMLEFILLDEPQAPAKER